jgi:hypothetical protein
LFSQLREANVRTESALKEAVEKKLVKEGEVTILRKTIEKVNEIASPNIAMLISISEFSKPRRSNSPTQSGERTGRYEAITTSERNERRN